MESRAERRMGQCSVWKMDSQRALYKETKSNVDRSPELQGGEVLYDCRVQQGR